MGLSNAKCKAHLAYSTQLLLSHPLSLSLAIVKLLSSLLSLSRRITKPLSPSSLFLSESPSRCHQALSFKTCHWSCLGCFNGVHRGGCGLWLVMCGDWSGEVGFEFGWVQMGFWLAEGDRVGSNGDLIGVGSVEIGVLIGVYGDRVLITWVSFQWGFDRVDFSGGYGSSFWPWVTVFYLFLFFCGLNGRRGWCWWSVFFFFWVLTVDYGLLVVVVSSVCAVVVVVIVVLE